MNTGWFGTIGWALGGALLAGCNGDLGPASGIDEGASATAGPSGATSGGDPSAGSGALASSGSSANGSASGDAASTTGGGAAGGAGGTSSSSASGSGAGGSSSSTSGSSTSGSSSSGSGGAASGPLSQVAAAMSPGDWVDFAMGGLSDDIVTAEGPSQHSIMIYAARAVWDPTHKKIQYAGTSHTGGQFVPGAGGLITWDDATNQWSRETYTWSSEAPGHAYYHLAVDPDSGDLFFRQFNSSEIKRRAYGTTGESSWQSGVVADHPDQGNQVAGGLEWFAELNGNSGGLVFIDTVGAAWSNAALSSWQTQAGTSLSGGYHNWIAHAGGYVYWGGGGGSSDMYRLSPSGTVTTMPDTPGSVGVNTNDAIILAHPNGTDLLLFSTTVGGELYDFDGSSWSSIGTSQVGDEFWVGVPIPDYGVVVFIGHPGATGAPYARVFKP